MIGHVEWIDFARVNRLARTGDIVHATEAWEEPGGGGAVAAVQLARLAGACDLYTALGEDDAGVGARDALELLGVSVHAGVRRTPTRRAVTFIDPAGERTITTLGERLEPSSRDPLPWDRLEAADAVYVTAGDAGAFHSARAARVMVVTTRVLGLLADSEVPADAVVGSSNDPAERFDPDVLSHRPGMVVLTDGARGGTYETADGRSGAYAPSPPPAGSSARADTYGGGDAFAAGLTFALGAGWEIVAALTLAARCGAYAVSGRGPYEGQLRSVD